MTLLPYTAAIAQAFQEKWEGHRVVVERGKWRGRSGVILPSETDYFILVLLEGNNRAYFAPDELSVETETA